MRETSELEWIQAAIARHEQPLLRFASHLVGAAHAADIVQDTFLALCKASRTDIEPRLAPWLFIVCKHRAVDFKRERSRLAPLDESRGVASRESEPASKVERRQSLSRVEQIVEQLPEQQRQALVLRFSAGMSYKEIAEVMELSVAHVGVVLHTAIKSIRGQLGEDARAALRSVP